MEALLCLQGSQAFLELLLLELLVLHLAFLDEVFCENYEVLP
jgi:hypothetical protein